VVAGLVGVLWVVGAGRVIFRAKIAVSSRVPLDFKIEITWSRPRSLLRHEARCC